MSLKSFIARKWAAYIRKQIDRWAADPIATQEKVFRSIIQKAKHTTFGRDHHFEEIHSYEDFVRQVPIRDYEALAPYIEREKRAKKTSFGLANRFILPRPLALPAGLSIFP